MREEERKRFDRLLETGHYLLLVERERHPNIASKVLALALRRVANPKAARNMVTLRNLANGL